MAKKMSKGGKRFLSLIVHVMVLVVMVSLYDTARAMLKNIEPKTAASEKASKDKKESTVKKTPKEDTIKPISKTATKSTGKSAHTRLTETKSKMEARGTSMADLMAEKERRAQEKAAQEKAAQEKK